MHAYNLNRQLLASDALLPIRPDSDSVAGRRDSQTKSSSVRATGPLDEAFLAIALILVLEHDRVSRGSIAEANSTPLGYSTSRNVIGRLTGILFLQ